MHYQFNLCFFAGGSLISFSESSKALSEPDKGKCSLTFHCSSFGNEESLQAVHQGQYLPKFVNDRTMQHASWIKMLQSSAWHCITISSVLSALHNSISLPSPFLQNHCITHHIFSALPSPAYQARSQQASYFCGVFRNLQ